MRDFEQKRAEFEEYRKNAPWWRKLLWRVRKNYIARKLLDAEWQTLFVEQILRFRWIVNDQGELGVRVLGINCYYYKWDTPLMYEKDMGWRVVQKREFGETIRSPLVPRTS